MMKIASVLVLLVVVCYGGVIAKSRPPVMTPGEAPSQTNPEDLCNYFAANSDMTNAGITGAISDECTRYLGSRPAGVNVNVDDEPYKMCLVAGTVRYGSLEPVTGQQVIAKDSFNNTSDQTITHSFSLTGAYTQSIAIATTNTVTLSVSVDYSVSIPDIFSSKFSVSSTFTTSKTQTNSATSSINYNPGYSLTCAPHCSYAAEEKVDVSMYKTDMNVPICLSGYARCNYNSRVQGHYLWYFLVDDFLSTSQRCFTQQGMLSSSVSDINSATSISKQCY